MWSLGRLVIWFAGHILQTYPSKEIDNAIIGHSIDPTPYRLVSNWYVCWLTHSLNTRLWQICVCGLGWHDQLFLFHPSQTDIAQCQCESKSKICSCAGWLLIGLHGFLFSVVILFASCRIGVAFDLVDYVVVLFFLYFVLGFRQLLSECGCWFVSHHYFR